MVNTHLHNHVLIDRGLVQPFLRNYGNDARATM